jgi:broad specificity phosphatase PhoE
VTTIATDASSLIGLLRHGETEGAPRFLGRTDAPLSARGLQQMRAALTDSGAWEAIVSSPLSRCASFARELARERVLPLVLDARLVEVNFGLWEGRTAAALMATDAEALGRFWRDPASHPPPGAESLQALQSRVLVAWEAMNRRYSGQKVLLISHGGPIRVILCQVLQHPLERLLEIEVGHAALFRVRVRNGADGVRRAELLPGGNA